MIPARGRLRARLMAIALLCAAPAWANMGKPWREALLVAEPRGFDAVRIVHEDLRIDLSYQPDLAEVQVDYRLHNTGPAVRLRPVFATGANGVAQFQARLDGRPIAAQPLQQPTLPKTWQPPATTPGLSGEAPRSYEVDQADSLALDFVLPPGQHDFSVSYRAPIMQSMRDGPTLLYQFAYVLAPARSWAGFGGLDVRVTVPDGWRFASEPALRIDPQDRDPYRDEYRGRYAALPADAIAITTQAPPGIGYQVLSWATLLLLGLAVLGGWSWCAMTGNAIARRAERAAAIGRAQTRRVWPYGLAAGAVWGLAVTYTGLAAVYAPERLLPQGQGYHFGYGQGLAAIAVVALAILLTLAGAIAVSAIARRRLRRHRADAV
ncbi:hypothetical protein LVB77_08940 [Lysobacter sp. 5GHs7-4]|uniref:hypothetical protein n=1 Tax=Lysobacter sp. 5GHs7-4 TaxID=2904253 RepID=UPI001E307A14|nr:hypothetical protein [Lysobacter sp. 5GHs7-4]UHQ24786.1 hypothetical protein LVB77_08940 [Lysobacter sp. 5GHs7-4]